MAGDLGGAALRGRGLPRVAGCAIARRRGVSAPAGSVSLTPRRRAARRCSNVSEGFLTNFLNPAIATFYLVVVPQFVPAGAPVARSVLLLMTVHVATALTWHLVWAAAGATLARTLTAGPARRALDAATAVALLVLAGRVLMSSR